MFSRKPKDAAPQSVAVKMKPNEILAKHGPAGWLVRSLQRYSLLGWGLFFLTLLLHFFIVALSSIAPRPIVAVDESGKVLGALEYLKPSTRSDDEIIAASKRFAELYMSLNAATIYDDYAQAMNMMGPELLAGTKESLKADNYLGRVEKAKARSWLEFPPRDGVQIVSRDGMNARVRLTGLIWVDAGGGAQSKPFDITLETRAVARNSNNTSGLLVISRKDN